jgi:hypothetical protein
MSPDTFDFPNPHDVGNASAVLEDLAEYRNLLITAQINAAR